MAPLAPASFVGVSDAQMREMVNDIPVPQFDATAFTVPPPLAEATVAIVTTAGLFAAGQERWQAGGDQSFRVLDSSDRNLSLGHWSPNFDRVGLVADLNVAYPADRLEEMAAEGAIGGVGRHHLSFMGAQDETMATIRVDTGPAAAKVLRDDGVDVVLLTPV